MPRSTTEMTGISGSGTSCNHCMTCVRVTVDSRLLIAVTSWRLGRRVANAAFLPANNLALRYVGPARHHDERDDLLLRQPACAAWLPQGFRPDAPPKQRAGSGAKEQCPVPIRPRSPRRPRIVHPHAARHHLALPACAGGLVLCRHPDAPIRL